MSVPTSRIWSKRIIDLMDLKALDSPALGALCDKAASEVQSAPADTLFTAASLCFAHDAPGLALAVLTQISSLRVARGANGKRAPKSAKAPAAKAHAAA